MSNGYWDRFTRSRIGRRKALAAAGAVGAGAAALSLVGCGGDGEDSGDATPTGPKDTSGLLYSPADTTKTAKKGGVYKALTSADVTSFDPLSSQSFTTQVAAGGIYSRLLKIVPGVLRGSAGDVEGDLAEKWEVSDDKQQITLTLRQNVKWDARAPTNSRQVVADDVVFSWNKFKAQSPYAAALANSEKNKDAPILSMTAPDQKTVVVKLAFPDASALTMLASSAALYIMPKEADGQFDPKGEMRGSGPWFIESYKPSQSFLHARNPNWYRSDIPFMDKAEYPIVPEYSSQLAQLRAGNVYGAVDVKQEDVLPLKRDIPAMNMYQGGFNRLWFNSWFGYQGDSPFKDKRVRQAWSMAIDRDLWIQTIYATENFSKEGLPVSMRWHSHFPSGMEGWWVDPQDAKAFGPNAKFLTYDPSEAKKLLSAAGFPNGVEVNAYHIATLQYGLNFVNQVQIQIGNANDIGFKTKISNPDYQTDWLNKYYYSKGAFNGIAIGADNPEPDPGVFMFLRFHPSGGRFKGLDPSGTDPTKGDPAVTAMIDKIRIEFDPAKRKEIAKQYQQYMADAMYAIPFPGNAAPFNIVWPCMGNAGVYRVGGEGYATATEVTPFLWLDQTKQPIAKT